MAKYIFVFLDGTGNKPGQVDLGPDGDEAPVVVESNVLKFWKALTGVKIDFESEDLVGDALLKYYGLVRRVTIAGEQCGEAIYINGVGVQGGAIKETLEGASGEGTDERIRDAYRFVAEQYEPGARICLFGFSRGAFAARSLAGFINHVGLPIERRIIPEKSLRKMYESYSGGKVFNGPLRSQLKPESVFFIGAWDTVGSLALDKTFNSFHKISTRNVLHVRHALALDEARPHFRPSYWEHPWTGMDVKECWFIGAHSNVGGGYKMPGLSNIPYIWMLREFAECAGLNIDVGIDPNYEAENAELGEIRNSFEEFYSGVFKEFILLLSFKNSPESRKVRGWQSFHPSVYDVMKKQHNEVGDKYFPAAQIVSGKITLEYVKSHLLYAADWPFTDE